MPSTLSQELATNFLTNFITPSQDKNIFDSEIGLDVKTVKDSKESQKSFDFSQPIESILKLTTDIDLKSIDPSWLKPSERFNPDLRDLKFRRIFDASNDGSLNEAFEDGALKINLNSSSYDHLNRITIGRARASVSAKDLETGETIDLGTQSINPTDGSFLVDLKDKLNAISTGSLRDHYDIQVKTFIGNNPEQHIIESFNETITLIKPLEYGSNHLGDETINDFHYRDIGSDFGSARIFQGRGGTDSVRLEGVNSTDVSFFNGRGGIEAASAAELGQQSFYGGTVFDSLGLANGDELYLQGIERLEFDDTVIELSPDVDTQSDRQWNTQAMDVNGAWRFNTGSDEVILVSLDTGFDGDANGSPDIHGDLSHVDSRTAVNTMATSSDHGHQAMSVMAAAHDNSEVAGVAPDAQLWGYNIYAGGMSLYDAINDAITNHHDGQKLVFQGGIQGEDWWEHGSSAAQMNELIGSTEDFGFFSIAAGNGGGTRFVDPNYLSSVSGVAKASTFHDNVASVGALRATAWATEDGLLNASGTELANYSNRGKNLTLVAPTNSESIRNSDGAVVDFGGTSCANPNLAGVTALVWSENGDLDGGEVREILMGSAMDLGAGGFDNTFGFGLVNAEGAIRRAHALDQNAELASFWTNQEFLA